MSLVALTDYVNPLNSRIFLLSCQVSCLTIKIFAPLKRLRKAGDHYVTIIEDLLERASTETEVAMLKRKKDAATTLKEYETYTEKLDQRQGHEQWKTARDSIEPYYYPMQIEAQIRVMQDAILHSDPDDLRRVLQMSFQRHLGGMDNIRLYKHSWHGTKALIDEYNETAVAVVATLIDAVDKSKMSKQELYACREAIEAASGMYGRTALSLSGGALLGMKHIGIAKCLFECNLLPQVISGTSAGSIVAGIVGVHTDEEMAEVLRRFPTSNLGVFDDQHAAKGVIPWCYRRLRNFYLTGTWFDATHLREVMKSDWLYNYTFQEAFNKTHRILNITISKSASAEPLILNHITTPNVLIWSAVCASCAVPWRIFPEATVYEKDPKTGQERVWREHAHTENAFTYVDGSLDHDIPMRKLKETLNVQWSIVAQSNPHVRPFLTREESFDGRQPRFAERQPSYAEIASNCGHALGVHTAQKLSDLGLPPQLWRWGAVLTQQYTGNINILPDYNLQEVCTMVANPSPEYMAKATRDGEKATWPKICRIRNSVAIELALEQGRRDLTERLHFSAEDRAAREDNRALRRGRAHRRHAYTRFLRRRSVSVEVRRAKTDPSPSWEYTAQGGLAHRRNQSLGSLELPLPKSRAASPGRTPLLSPQVGVSARSLMMTPVAPGRKRE